MLSREIGEYKSAERNASRSGGASAATLLQPRRLAEHSLLERLVGFLRGLKHYSGRIVPAAVLPVCSSDSNGRTSGMYRKTDLTAKREKTSVRSVPPRADLAR